ncbi:hypothetical protein AB0F18_39310 [Streptomyces sp. NPDC029216]|uniref:hypothetical protein n=1 Tax=Streptomyces sp. NPDC029216 TaxID=3154701 RepID=UPI0033E22A5A
MSYDLAVWDGEQPLDDEAAGLAFDELFERYLESEEAAVPLSPRIDAYVNALIERYPEDGRDSPWASPPVIDEASGPIVTYSCPTSAPKRSPSTPLRWRASTG